MPNLKKQRKPTKAEMAQEIAPLTRDVWQQAWGEILQRHDPNLLGRISLEGVEIYREVEQDTQIAGLLRKRRLAVVRRPWRVLPGGEAPADKRCAKAAGIALRELSFDDACDHLLDALLLGYALCEVLWEPRNGLIAPVALKKRRSRRFVFDVDKNPRLLTQEQPSQGEALPLRKFIVHTVGGNDDSPYGKGLGEVLYWPAFFKRHGMKFWLNFLERFGGPTAIGKYPQGTDQAKQNKLADALNLLSTQTGIIIPQGMEIELIQASGKGGDAGYEALLRYLDAQSSVLVLGETLTTDVGDQGSRAAAQVHAEVASELSEYDGALLDATLNASLLRWFQAINFPSAKAPRLAHDFTPPLDETSRVARDKTLHEMGVKPTDPAYWGETYGGEWEQAQPPQPQPAPAFASSTPPSLEGLANQASNLPATRQVWAGLSERVEEILRGAKDWPEAQNALLEAFSTLDEDALANLMGRAMAAAELAGMADVGEVL